jgi:hypothetical protein
MWVTELRISTSSLLTKPRLAVVLSEGSNSQHACFKQTISVDFYAVAETVTIDEGNYAGSHWEAQSIIFSCFQSIFASQENVY